MSKLLLASTALVAANAASVTIEFEFYEATYEANAIDQWDYDYEDATAHDSHNEWIDICERIYITDSGAYVNGAQGDSINEQCCTPDDRSAMIDGCANVFEANGWDTAFLPQSCDTYSDAPCSGVQTDSPAAFVGEYDACDYSYNCAEQVTFEALILDTTPPVIGCEVDSEGACWWNENVEKCTYFDVLDLEAADDVDFIVDISYSVAYGGTVSANTDSSSGQSCSGGVETSDNAVDVDTPGVYCVQYDAWDNSENVAISETFVAIVEDTTDPNLYFETEAVTIECAVESCVPDAGASSDNVPCDDEPEVVWDDSDVDLNSVGVWDIVYSTDDGYNGVSSTFTVTIEDTTPPTITCPNDYVYEYLDTYSEGSATAADTCSDITQSDDQYDAYPVEGGILSEIGTYYATYDVVDAAGLTASCQQEVVVQDTTPPECEFVGDEYVTVEACTGEYTELGVECTDHYDDDLSPWCDGDCGAVDEWTVGTYVITYGVTDVNGNSATDLTRYVTVQDTTDPVIVNEGSDATVLEASNPEHATWDIGAKCTDTCLAITSQGKVNTGMLGYSPDDSDLEQYIEFSIDAVAYANHGAYSADWGTALAWYDASSAELLSNDLSDMVVDEQQYYCGESDASAMQKAAAAANADQADSGDIYVSDHIQSLSDACGLYVATYTCTDAVGNTATSTQYIYTRDTIAPVIYSGSFASSAVSLIERPGGVLMAVVGIAFVAGVALQRRKKHEGYNDIDSLDFI